MCEKVQILRIPWTKEPISSQYIANNKVSKGLFYIHFFNTEVWMAVNLAGLTSNLIENETLAIK